MKGLPNQATDLAKTSLGIQALVRLVVAEPGQEDVDQAVATGARCGLRHPADDLPGDPEPHLGAGRGECGPEPAGPAVGFQVGVERCQGSRATWPVLARPINDDHQRAVGHRRPANPSP